MGLLTDRGRPGSVPPMGPRESRQVAAQLTFPQMLAAQLTFPQRFVEAPRKNSDCRSTLACAPSTTSGGEQCASLHRRVVRVKECHKCTLAEEVPQVHIGRPTFTPLLGT